VYLEEVMPHKLEMYMCYVEDQNFWMDLRLILAPLGKMAGLHGWFLVPEVASIQECEYGCYLLTFFFVSAESG
jgi:hypothetical protein